MLKRKSSLELDFRRLLSKVQQKLQDQGVVDPKIRSNTEQDIQQLEKFLDSLNELAKTKNPVPCPYGAKMPTEPPSIEGVATYRQKIDELKRLLHPHAHLLLQSSNVTFHTTSLVTEQTRYFRSQLLQAGYQSPEASPSNDHAESSLYPDSSSSQNTSSSVVPPGEDESHPTHSSDAASLRRRRGAKDVSEPDSVRKPVPLQFAPASSQSHAQPSSSLVREILDQEKDEQSLLTDELVELTRSFKEYASVSTAEITNDVTRLRELEGRVDVNLNTLQTLNNQADIQVSSSWSATLRLWLICIIVILVFIFMVVFIKIT